MMLVSDMDEIACDAQKSGLCRGVELIFSLEVRMSPDCYPTMGRALAQLIVARVGRCFRDSPNYRLRRT